MKKSTALFMATALGAALGSEMPMFSQGGSSTSHNWVKSELNKKQRKARAKAKAAKQARKKNR